MKQRNASPVWLAGLLGMAGVIGWVRNFGRRTPRLSGVDPEDLEAGHERSDMSVGAIMIFGVCLLAGMVIAGVTVNGLLLARAGRPAQLGAPPGEVADPTSVAQFPQPQLQAVPGQELQELRAREQQQVHGYRWVDRGNGIVAIPIERAMDIVATQGLPARASPSPAVAQGPASDASSGRTAEAAQP